MGKYFGTDGVRDVANTELTSEFTLKSVIFRDEKNFTDSIVYLSS